MLGKEAPGLKPRKSLASDAADSLRELILLEKLQPGSPIPERDVAEALGISRTPLREALKQLEIDGLIEYSATRRPKVANPSLEELHQSLTVLGSLEALAGELASRNANKLEIEKINRLCDTMLEQSDTAEPLEFFKYDMQFHSSIVSASGNPALLQTHRQYNAKLWRARFLLSVNVPNRNGILVEHCQIADGLKRRDEIACSTAMKQHLQSAITNIDAVMQQSGTTALNTAS